MDFQNLEGLSELLESRLGVYGFARTSHRLAINQLLRQLTEVELEPGMSLRDIPKHERLSEVEFSHPLAHLTPASLAKAIGKRGTLAADVRERMEGFVLILLKDSCAVSLICSSGSKIVIFSWTGNPTG